jgi:murein tripeptide amidase MpaA
MRGRFSYAVLAAVAALLVSGAAAQASQLVRIPTPTHAHKQKLQSLGLDLTEHGGRGFLEVVVHSERDLEALRDAGFAHSVVVEDLEAQARADARADARYAQSTSRSPVPSGRTGYRTYQQYLDDMDKLVRDYPGLVKPITLTQRSFQGREIKGVEITNNVDANDGKPVFLMMGLHHAREWPSGEHTIEWAFELATNYGKDSRTTDLVNRVRTIIVPVVNPDGFILSRSSRPDDRGDPGTGDQRVDENLELVRVQGDPAFEFKRKNCRVFGGNVPCESNRRFGVDLNRNYGGFWGGPGSGSGETAEDYRGSGPFSEPETQAVRELIAGRQVTTLVTNHTFSNLVLRPPGVATQGIPPDNRALEALGAAMAEQNGYANIPGYGLYDTSGTTEDWSYYTTGGYGYTFEIGPNRFHPLFERTVDVWTGAAARRRPGATGSEGGNREAYYIAMQNAANSAHHSVIAGSAAPGNLIRLKKEFQTATARGSFADKLESTFRVPPSGNFEWHINPSTRPVVAGHPGRIPEGPPSGEITFTKDQADAPCAVPDTEDESCKEDNEFTVPGRPNDNGYATVRIEWPEEASDWDMAIYRKNPSGSLTKVGSSAQGGTDHEEFTIVEPTPDGQPVTYVARVVNFAAVTPWTGKVTFENPKPAEPGSEEAWTASCERPDGTVVASGTVSIKRGEVAGPGIDCGGPARAAQLDLTPPGARLLLPRVSSSTSRNSNVNVRWTGTDAGTGIASYLLEVREVTGRAHRSRHATPYTILLPATTATRHRFKGRRGRSYRFRLRAVDFAGNMSRAVARTTVVPLNDRARRARYRGFRRVRSRRAYYGGYRMGQRGDRMSFRYRGGHFYLVGLKSRRGGRAVVTVSGRRRVFNTRARRARHRRVLVKVPRKVRRHRVRVRVLSGQVAIDALGIYRRR